MTKEEAIQFLSQIMDALLASNSWLPSTDNPIKESFGMAINALKAQEQLSNKSPELDNNIGDRISRQAVLDWLKNEWNGRIASLFDGIKALPSAQPETHDKRTKTHSCDCISRQAAIDVLEERLQANGYSNVALVSEFNRSIGYLMRLPSAQPEIIRCKDCKWKQGAECVRFADVRPFADDFCSRAERRTDEAR